MVWCDGVVESDRFFLQLLRLKAWGANFGSRVHSEAPNECTLEGDFREIAWSGRKDENNSAIVVPLLFDKIGNCEIVGKSSDLAR